MFVRVVHRQGWDVGLVDRGMTRTFPSREEAMAFAQGEQPDWIEVGEVVYATETVPQHHRCERNRTEAGISRPGSGWVPSVRFCSWRTLRRRQDGTYPDLGLGWGGRNV